ncbi:Sodium:neurotransmitter symporter family protein [Caprobacter fermentans]|uniref:Transporter n=1 Tax=Caproicibacter fermentans TaxID=2576756 RepID=A0A6N8HXN2_9FIRM|nr:sodium-dependent transporter [Caproicibacter fermentans]MVB10512.1 Sodium:neurotransmitter symporter family protein [Caproicibacter fermentans]
MDREQWGSRWGFVLAAVGSAIGLGNIWRFPYVAYKNGGGAFLIPYMFALLTTGLSFVALEFVIGKKYRGSAPLSYFRINRRMEFVGWWQFAISFVIMTYYAVILGWAMSYIGFSATLAWGTDTKSFLFNSYLNVLPNASVTNFGGIEWHAFIPLLIIWVITLAISYRGVKQGIERVSKIAIPTLVFLFLIFVIRAVTLPGSSLGLNAFFEPQWNQLLNPEIWKAAYSQIFYSLSLAMGIMITYSSYLPEKTDTTNNAFIAAFSNSGFELLAGFGIFAALGFMAHNSGVAVKDLAAGGIGLAFVVLPQIINQLPFPQFFGIVFFACLLIAGITSLISLLEVCISAATEKFGWDRHRAVLTIGGLATLVSVAYSTRGGMYLLDVVDNFVNGFGVLPSAVFEIVLVLWVFHKMKPLMEEANLHSQIRLGGYFKISLGFITPVMLVIILFSSLITNISTVYGGYPVNFVGVFGWGMVILMLVFAVLISRLSWKDKRVFEKKEEKE